jgi:hypothetical protein
VLEENYLPLQNATVYTQRYYVPTASYSTVDAAQTDSNGETLAHLDLEDTIYNFIVGSDGNCDSK